jgi:hypothetical protein
VRIRYHDHTRNEVTEIACGASVERIQAIRRDERACTTADCKEFVDVGANEGAFTFLHPQMRLHWFEPDRQLARRLAINLTRNNIVAYGNELAVAERRGTATFFKTLAMIPRVL